MGRIYTFAFDSTNYIGGNNNNKRQYVTNWNSVLPERTAFKVTFSYMSVVAAIVNTPTLMTLHMDLGQTSVYQGSSTPFGFTPFIGNILVGGTDGANEYYYATSTTNPPIYINSRPQYGLTEVRLHQGLTVTNYNTPIPADYVLMVSFEECD